MIRQLFTLAIFVASGLSDEWPALSPYSNQISHNVNASFSLFARSEPLFLDIRQEVCVDAGYVPCTNIPGKCCLPSDNCLSDGCCNKDFETCEGTGCYETGATCCPNGGACNATENCLLGKCCAKTAETCSGTGCYDAGAVCCSGGGACASGQACCASGCMPGTAGNTCCSSGWCGAGFSCCEEAKKCCPTGSICCPGTCCPSGSECATQYGYCNQLVTSTSAPSSTSSSQASSTTSSPLSISTPKLPTSTSSCIAPGPSLSAAAIAVLPVIEFLYIETDYEPYGDIVKSMCLGMQARNSSGNIFNQDVLTYAGSKDPCYEARRRNAKCKGCCKNVIKNSGPFAGFNTSCDEYPFASTAEGGTGAHRSCVVAFENDLQGGYLSAFYAKLQYGQQFVVRISGIDCSTVQESDLQGCGGVTTAKRQQSADGVTLTSGYEDTVRYMGYNNTNALIISFGDLDNGDYESRIRLLSGQVDAVTIVSNSGRELASNVSLTDLSGSGSILDFSLDDGEYGVGAIVYTAGMTANVSYEFAVNSSVSSASTTSATPSTTPTNPSRASVMDSSLGLVIAISLAVVMLCGP